MGYLDFIPDSDYEEYKRRRDKRRLGYGAGEVDENWRAAIAGMRAPVRLPAPPMVSQPTIPLPPQGPTVSSGWTPPQEPGYEPPTWRGPVTSTPPSDPTWLSAIGKRDVTPFTADMGTPREPTIPIPGSLTDTISLPTIKAPLVPDGQLPPWSRATLGSVYEDVDRSALRPFRGLATEAFEPDQQGRYQFPPAKAIGDVVTGLRDPARIPEWWQGLAERQQGREERGEPYIPIDPSWLGLGEYKALAQMAKPAITETGKAATVVGQAAKRWVPKVDEALRSPVLERLAPGGTIEDVSAGYPNIASAINKEATRINAINERQSARTSRPFGAEMEQRQWELWGLLKRNNDAIAAGQAPILHPDRVNEIGKELGAIEAYKRQEATRPSITYPNVTARPAIPRAEDVTPESLKRWEEPPRRPEGQPSAPSGMQYPNVGDLRRQRHYAEAGFNITKEPEPLGWYLWGPKGGLLGSYPSRREADAALRRIAKQRGIGEEAATYAPAAKRYYHGTGSAFDAPDAAKFDPNGLYGPGYYITDNPEVAGSYAATRGQQGNLEAIQTRIDNLQRIFDDESSTYAMRSNAYQEMARLQKELDRAPQIRAVDVPENLRLFNAESDARRTLAGERSDIQETIDDLRRRFASFDDDERTLDMFDDMMEGVHNPSGTDLYRALMQTAEGDKEWANLQLQAIGFDGISYTGGKRTPMRNAAGVPIEHDALVIFPESLPKIKNAISGTPMGTPPEVGGAVLGSTMGAMGGDENTTLQERARNWLVGGVTGGVVGAMARRGRVPGGTIEHADEYLESFTRRNNEIEERLADIEQQLEKGLFAQEKRAARRELGHTIERPPRAGRLTNEQLEEIAAEAGVSPYESSWWERVDPEAFKERGVGRRSGKYKLTPLTDRGDLDRLDKEWKALTAEKERLNAEYERRYQQELERPEAELVLPDPSQSSLESPESSAETPPALGKTVPGVQPGKALPSKPSPPESIVTPEGLTLKGQGAAVKVPKTEQEAMFAAGEPGARREFPRGAKPAEPVRQADLLGGEQFEDDAARARIEREQALKAGQQEMAAAAKEPWQMTRDEAAGKPTSGYIEAKKTPREGGKYELYYRESPNKVEMTAGQLYNTPSQAKLDYKLRSHKAAVETALTEGKPVPPKVLADYPDLAAKYGKAAEAAADKRNMAARTGLADAEAPIPSWATKSNAFNEEAQPYRDQWIATAAKNNKLGTTPMTTTWYGANHVAIGGGDRVRFFLQEALGRPVEPYREGWLVTADEAAWLGFEKQARRTYTAKQLEQAAAAEPAIGKAGPVASPLKVPEAAGTEPQRVFDATQLDSKAFVAYREQVIQEGYKTSGRSDVKRFFKVTDSSFSPADVMEYRKGGGQVVVREGDKAVLYDVTMGHPVKIGETPIPNTAMAETTLASPPELPSTVPATIAPEARLAPEAALPVKPSVVPEPEMPASVSSASKVGREKLPQPQGRPTEETRPVSSQTENISQDTGVQSPPSPPRDASTTTIVPPPDGPPPVEVSVTAPKTAGFQQFWNRARNVIADQGPSGKVLANKLEETRDLAETTAGNWVYEMPGVRALTKHEFDNFVDVAEGNAKAISPRVTEAVQEWSTVREAIYNAAEESGIDVGHLEDYFPHTYDPKMFKGDNFVKAVNHLVKTGQAKTATEAAQMLRYAQDVIRNRRQGNLEIPRIVDLPGYERTKTALFRYVESAANRIAQVRVLGKDDEEAMALLARIGDEGGDASAAKHLFDISVGAQKYGAIQKEVSGVLRALNVFTKLGLGALTNATQSLNTATVVGGLRTLLKTPEAMFSPEARDFALKAGITLDGTISRLREGGGFAGKAGKVGAPGFNTVERFNRTLAAVAGVDYAEEMARNALKGDKKATLALSRMGLSPAAIVRRDGVLTDAEKVRAAQDIVKRTQFKVDPQDLPGWTDSPWGKVISQFRTFSYNQSAFIGRELISPALKGNVKPLIRFLIYGLPVGAGMTELQNFLRNRPSEEDPVQRIRQYYQRVGGLGVLGDLAAGLAPPNSKYLPAERYALQAAGLLGGPTVSTALEGVGSIPSALQGKPENIERFVLKQIPVVGPTLKNTLLPYKPGGRGAPQLTPMERYIQGQSQPGQSRQLSPMEKYLKSKGAR